MKKAMLFVSFGTSYKEAREKNINKIVNHISSRFEHYDTFQAFTSNIIRKKLKMQGIEIYSVDDALSKIKSLGYKDVIIVSLHLITGFEYEKMLRLASEFEFDSVKITTALLYDKNDYKNVATILDEIYSDIKEPLILMGHGTEHKNDISYKNLQEELDSINKEKYIIITIDGSITIQNALHTLKEKNVPSVYLAPFMLVCGDHAYNDMAGECEDSIMNILKANNIKATPILKGLGEYEQIGDYFAKKVKNIIGE